MNAGLLQAAWSKAVSIIRAKERGEEPSEHDIEIVKFCDKDVLSTLLPEHAEWIKSLHA